MDMLPSVYLEKGGGNGRRVVPGTHNPQTSGGDLDKFVPEISSPPPPFHLSAAADRFLSVRNLAAEAMSDSSGGTSSEGVEVR